MRIIVEVLGRAWMVTFQGAKLTSSDDCEESSQYEAAPPPDPHAVHGGQFEQGPGADAFTSDVTSRGFGFRGR